MCESVQGTFLNLWLIEIPVYKIYQTLIYYERRTVSIYKIDDVLTQSLHSHDLKVRG